MADLITSWYCLPSSKNLWRNYCLWKVFQRWNKSVKKNDILFLFIRPVYVNTWKRVDSRYTYAAQKTEEDDSDDDSNSGDNAIEIDESMLGNIDFEC